MTVAELKKAIVKKSVPNKMVWVDQNHSLVEHYLDQISLALNMKLKKLFNIEEALHCTTFDFDVETTIYLLYLSKKDVIKVMDQIGEAFVIAMVEEELKTTYTQITFDKISRNACLVFMENYVAMPKRKTAKKDDEFPEETVTHHISRELLERAVDYFENDLDRCMNEIKKVEVLELNGSWDHPFKALLDCLPKKDKKLRSLSWFNGGDIDTCQVLYNLYIKKLRSLPDASLRDQELWAMLIRESVWCEACVVSGLMGDYVMDYLKLIESSLPEDFTLQYFPPVFFHEVERSPEWMPKEE